jgi:hypothetical protein
MISCDSMQEGSNRWHGVCDGSQDPLESATAEMERRKLVPAGAVISDGNQQMYQQLADSPASALKYRKPGKTDSPASALRS